MRLWLWFRRLKEFALPARQIELADADAPLVRLPRRNLVLLRDGSDNWCIVMRCPCGCGRHVELPLTTEASPRWRLEWKEGQPPTLHPSVWLRDGCRSHFHLWSGRVSWI
jgi:hypothetical protein